MVNHHDSRSFCDVASGCNAAGQPEASSAGVCVVSIRVKLGIGVTGTWLTRVVFDLHVGIGVSPIVPPPQWLFHPEGATVLDFSRVKEPNATGRGCYPGGHLVHGVLSKGMAICIAPLLPSVTS